MYGYHSHEDNKSVQNFKEGPLRLHRAKILSAGCTLI